MLAGEGVHNAGGQLLHIGAVDALADLLDQNGVRLADVEDEILLLVGEQDVYKRQPLTPRHSIIS